MSARRFGLGLAGKIVRGMLDDLNRAVRLRHGLCQQRELVTVWSHRTGLLVRVLPARTI